MSTEGVWKEHAEAVARVQNQVKHFYDNKQQFRIYHGSTSSTRPLNFASDGIVDVSDMARIFPIDVTNKTIQVEPKVAMDALVAATLKVGLVPQVVMEFKGITAGGGYAGLAGESSSFKYGPFHSSCAEIEIVLGDGTVTKASPHHEPDLFVTSGGTLGTMGVITLLTVKLIHATSHVDLELQYMPDPQSIPPMFEDVIQKGGVDFIDAVYFGKQMAVLMLGRMTDKPSAPVFRKMQVHWFADEIRKTLERNKNTQTVSLWLSDYLFRYDHGAFWGGKLAFEHFHVPNNRFTRKCLDPLLDSRTCYQALYKSGLANEYLVQDFGIPISNAPTFISWVTQTLPQLQIFMCPVQKFGDFTLSDLGNPRFREKSQERLIGLGVYGRGPSNTTEFIEMNRKLEQKAYELLGAKMLYSRVYLTADEFWSTYNKDKYDELRRRYKADTLPNVFDKIAADMSKMPKRRPVRGVLETLFDKARGRTHFVRLTPRGSK